MAGPPPGYVKPPNPSGLCMCGCGERTPIATITNRKSGAVKGEPQRYVFGHAGRRKTPFVVQDPKPCVRCKEFFPLADYHVRSVSPDGRSLYCKSCTSIKAKKSAARNPGKSAARSKKWRANNPMTPERRAKEKAYRAQYYQENKDKQAERNRKQREANREEYREYQREYMRRWRERNPERHAQANRMNARRRRGGGMAPDTRVYMTIIENDLCAYCGGPADQIDHVVPLARGGSNEWDNLTAACLSCNYSKGTTSLLQFLAKPREVPYVQAA